MKLVAAFAMLLFASIGLAQNVQLLQPTQNAAVPYRLFNTTNVYTLLKLDTRTGLVWQLQWGVDKPHRFIEPINSKPLIPDGKVGRFTLYPTSNIYTFILLDQEAGNAWYIQWGTPTDRFIVHID
jgi:hypothetical protein